MADSGQSQPSLPPPPSRPNVTPSSVPMRRDEILTVRLKNESKDFAVSAFQTPDKLEKLVHSLKEYDNTQLLNSGLIALSKGGRTLYRVDDGVYAEHPRAPSLSLSNSTGSTSTVRPRLTRAGSGSSTEKDEPKEGDKGEETYEDNLRVYILNSPETEERREIDGVEIELGGGGEPKKTAKQKKNKKKKAKGKAQQSEVKEDKEIKEPKNGLGVAEEREQSSLVNHSLKEEGVVNLADELESVMDDAEGKDAPGVSDISSDTSSSGVSIIITPDNPASRFLPVINVINNIQDEESEDEGLVEMPHFGHDVKVRLPGEPPYLPEGRPVIEEKTSPAEAQEVQDEEAKPPATTPSQRIISPSAQIGIPLTPPFSPVDSARAPEPPATLSNPIILAYDEPLTPPRVPMTVDPIISPSDYPDAKPLSKAWTLYHSNTGPSNAAAQPSKLSTIGVQGVLPALPAVPPHRTKAEEYSYGLFRLFTATNVVDLLGTWKALRRKIAYKKGRVIEPEGTRIAIGMEGLGIYHLPEDTNFHFFIASVKPMWEDPMCERGGKIMITGTPGEMDPLFFQVVLLLAGSVIDHACPCPPDRKNLAVGATLSRRKGHTRIEIWLGGIGQPPIEWVKSVEQFLKESLPQVKMYPYKSFKEPLRDHKNRSPDLGVNRGQGGGIRV